MANEAQGYRHIFAAYLMAPFQLTGTLSLMILSVVNTQSN
jgi:hypothetical protein